MIVNSPLTEEFKIITTNMNVIMDMVDDTVKVLTEMDTIVDSPCKTFMSNIHTLRYDLLENKLHQKTEEVKNEGVKKINKLIDRINKGGEVDKEEYDRIAKEVDMIGEPIIAIKLKEMLSEKITIKSKLKGIYESASGIKDEYYNEIIDYIKKNYKEEKQKEVHDVMVQLYKLYLKKYSDKTEDVIFLIFETEQMK